MHRLAALLALILLPGALQAERPAKAPFARIKKKYDIYVVVRDKPLRQKWAAGEVTADPADAADVKTYTPLLVEEFALYPVGFVKRTKLRQIVLVKNLRFGKQRRTSVPDFTRNVLYIDVSRGRKTEDYARRVIHHEYFHLIDYLDDGLLYEDPGWSKLNPAGFRYGRGGAAMRDANASLLSDKHPGFLNRYSTSGIEEDKAEVFSFMVMDYKTVEERAKKDKILKRKMAYMKTLARKFSRDMSDAFWRQRKKGRKGK